MMYSSSGTKGIVLLTCTSD